MSNIVNTEYEAKNLTTTIKTIYEHAPCATGFAKLLQNLFGNGAADPMCKIHDNASIAKMYNDLTTAQQNQTVTLLKILNSNGAEDAYWALQCWDYKDFALLLANVAESVVHIYSEQYPGDSRMQDCIDTVRAYVAGDCSKDDLAAAGAAARDAAWDAAWDDAWDAARAAARDAARAAARDAARAAARNVAWNAAWDEQWKRNEQMMRDFIAASANNQQDGKITE